MQKKFLYSTLFALIAPFCLNAANIQFDCSTTFYSQPGIRLMNRFRTNIPTKIAATNLPKGLKFNKDRNLVEGKLSKDGIYEYHITATADDGSSKTQKITLVVDSKLISPTPMMSWMSWNVYQDKCNGEKIKETADALVESGLSDCGWNYINIDDNWQAAERNADGTPAWDTDLYPEGISGVADYVHRKGLKLGIYSDAAEHTCAGEFGSLHFETIDADTYAKWGCDLLKYDYCGAPDDCETAKTRYTAMRKALDATSRPFFLNICEWGARKPWLWAADCGGNAWRISYDSRDTWDHGQYDNSHCGAVQAIDINKDLAYYAGPNHFNDMDMMCVGLYGTGLPSNANLPDNKGMTDTEYQSVFSMWSIFAAPLTISFDITTMNDATRRILTNKDIIAVNQDPMGQQALFMGETDGVEFYVKDLENGDYAVALLNRGNSTATVTADFAKLGLPKKLFNIRDLWKHSVVGCSKTNICAEIASHETKVYRLSLKK